MAGDYHEISLGLRITADTTQAKQSLERLKDSLVQLGSMNSGMVGEKISAGLKDATLAAARLKAQLDASTNNVTGNLDLNKFNKQLISSGDSLIKYRSTLTSLGPSGVQAFLSLTQAIQGAEVPILNLNKRFDQLFTTFKNTLNYTISARGIQAVISGIRDAYRYVQDLNKSLTDIRIVTGYSTDQMAQFASQANSAAKALSTTTNEYTKASLIFFQQGLTDDAVQERTDTTIKMANVTGQSAQQVSDQMTAVWNNFAKGGENLESYADKMVALGAATASSSSEIATGLEKFAAVADTVGLSFDYASAALATVTATTRQSADTVGTAFKTLFARLESLKMGDTLEDGTDLTKYSLALQAVGVNIKDANGELKDMDTILDETMAKWQTLNKDQQVALAQTVAGMRQYNQFIALMDSSDFFKENLATARGAEGTLQEQADIYAESWEAAQKRVKAAAEGIYGSLLDDQFFIKITNGVASALNFVNKLINAMGGLPGLLSAIGTLVFTIFGDKVANSIRSITFDIQNLLSHGQKAQEIKDIASRESQQIFNETQPTMTLEQQSTVQSYQRIGELQQIIAKQSKNMSDIDLEAYQTHVAIQRSLEDQVILRGKEVDLLNEEVDSLQENFSIESRSVKESQDKKLEKENAQIKQQIEEKRKLLEVSNEQIGSTEAEIKAAEKQRNSLSQKITTAQTNLGKGTTFVDQDALNKNIDKKNKLITKIEEDNITLDELKKEREQLLAQIKELEGQSMTLQQMMSGDSFNVNIKDNEKLKEVFNSEDIVSSQDIISKIEQQQSALSSLNIAYAEAAQIDSQYKNSLTELENQKTSLNEKLQEENLTEEEQIQIKEKLSNIEDQQNQIKEQQKAKIKEYIQSLQEEGVLTENEAKALLESESQIEVVGAARTSLISKMRMEIDVLRQTIQSSDLDKKKKRELLNVLNDIEKKYGQLTISQKKYNDAQQDANSHFNVLKVGLSNVSKGFVDYATTLTSAFQTISSLTMGISSFSNAIKNLSNPDMSAWEKFSSLMMSLPFFLGGVSKAISGLATTWNNLSIIQNVSIALSKIKNATSLEEIGIEEAENALKEKNIILTEGETAAEEGKIAIKKADVLATLMSIDADTAKAIATELKSKKDKEATVAAIAQILVTKQKIPAELASAAAEVLYAKAQGASNLEIIKNIGLQLLKHKTLLIVIAAIAALAAIIYVVVKAYNAENEKIKEQAEVLELLKNGATKTKEAYTELKDSIDQLKDSRKTLDELKEGTEEWKDKVLEVNEQVLKLLDLYPKLAKYISNVNGVLTISDEGYQALAAEQQERLQRAQEAEVAAQIQQNKVNVLENQQFYDKHIGNKILLTEQENEQLDSLYWSDDQKYITDQTTSIIKQAESRRDKIVEKLGKALSEMDEAYREKVLSNIGIYNEEIKEIFAGDTAAIEVAQKYQQEDSDFARNVFNYAEMEQQIKDYNDFIIESFGGKAILSTYGDYLDFLFTQVNDEVAKQINNRFKDNGLDDSISFTNQEIEKFKNNYATIIAKYISGSNAEILQQAEIKMDKARGAGHFSNRDLDDYLNNTKFQGKTNWDLNDLGYAKLYMQLTEGKTAEEIDKLYEFNDRSGYVEYKQRGDSSYSRVGGDSSNDNQIREYIAQQAMVQDMFSQTDLPVEDFENFTQNLMQIATNAKIIGAKFGTDFSTSLLQSLASGEVDFSDAILNMNLDAVKALKTASKEDLNTLGEGLFKNLSVDSQEFFTNLGFESMEAFMAAMQEDAKKYSTEDIVNFQINKVIGQDDSGLNSEEIADYAKHLMETAESSDKLDDALKNDAEAATEVAIAMMKMNRGLESLRKNQKDWMTDLNKSSQLSQEYVTAMSEVRNALADIFDTNKDNISEDFVRAHLSDIQAIIDGDNEKIDELRADLQDEIIVKFAQENNIFNDEQINEIKSKHDEIQEMLNNNELEIGATLDTSQFVTAANKLIEDSGMTYDQVQDYFNSMGYSPIITPIESELPAADKKDTLVTPSLEFEPFSLSSAAEAIQNIFGGGSVSLPKIRFSTESVDPVNPPKPETMVTGAITPEGKPTKFRVDGVKKIAAGGAANTRSGQKTGSGGGGGGGGSAKKPKKKEPDAKDRYHRIDKQVEKTKDEYEQLSKSRERAYGPAALKYMDEESKKLEEQITLIQKKRKEAEAYLKEDLADLNKYAAEAGFTVTYDDAGIVNYEDLKKQADEYYNAHVTGDSDADEWLEKWYENFTKMLDQYEETLKVIREQTNEEIEKVREKFDKELEKFQIQIDFNIEITDTLKKYWDYMDSRLDNFIDTLEKIDQVTQIAQQRILLEQSSMNNTIKQTKDALVNLGGVEQEAVDKLFETLVNGGDWTSIYGDPSGETGLVGALTGKTDENGKALIEFLNEGIEKVYQAITDQVEQAKRPAEQMVASYDKIIEDQERLLSNFEEYSAEITMYIDIADALGQRMSGMTRETLNVAREAQISVMQDKIDALAAERDRLQNNVLKEYQAKLEEAESRQGKGTAAEQASADADVKAFREAIDNIEDAIKEKQSEWRDSITEMAQMLKDNFTSAVEGVVNAFDYAISDMYNSVEKLQEAYDQRRTLEEQYIPEYKQVYELNKISRDLSKQLDTTDSLVAQKKLRDFQKEIYDLQNSGKKLSEYDLEYLQKKYDLRVAEIALEDAQNAKNQVRLSRDAEGNYSYVYTANEESTGKASQDYEDKMYALQELNDSRSKDLGSDYLAAIAEMEDAFRSMSEQDFESREDYERTKQLILDNFKERVAFITSQNDQILQNNKDLYEQDYLGYVDLIKNITSSNEAFQMKNSDFATEFSDTILGKVMPSYSSMKNHASSVIAAIEADQDGLIAQIDTAYESLQNGIADMYANLGTTWSEHMTSLEGDERLVAFLNGNVEKFNTYKTDASTELEELADNASHEADRIISGFSGGESKKDAAFYLDAMEKSGTDAAAVFGTEGVFGKAAQNLVDILGGTDKKEGLTPALLGGADSAGLLASSLSDVGTNAPDTSSAIKTMVENVAGPEGNSGYLATLKTGVDGLTGKIVAAGSSVKTDFVDPTETQIGALSTWIQGTGADQGVGQLSKAMETYVGTIHPTDFENKLSKHKDGSVIHEFDELNTRLGDGHTAKNNWKAAISSWSQLKGSDGKTMDTAINGKLQSVVQKFKDLGTNAKPGATYATDITGWTKPIVDNVGNGTSDNKAWHKLRLLGNAFSNISKNADSTKKSITDYNSVNPKDKKASTTITWTDNFSEWYNGKDGKSGFNKNLTDIDKKAADVSVTWKDNWDEFNKKLQEKINSVKEQSINVKLKVEDESGTASNVWNFNGKANSARSALQAIVGLKEASNEDLQAMDFDHNKSTSLLDAINWLRVSAKLPAITSINNETDKERLKSVLHLLEDALNQSETDIKDMQPEDIIKLIKELSEKAGIPYYDTGGYTGEWGDSGKLAMLHQKELVLNPVDTSNILAAVDLVRQAAQAIDLSARASQYAMGSNLAAATTASIVNSNDLNQNVTIYAEFPGVSVEAEIQNAFNAMEMQAIQYAHRDY